MPFAGSLKCLYRNDWFYPGDRGFVRRDGLFVVLGRADNVINSGGTKRNAEAIENALSRHPLIRDVAVLGVGTGARTSVRAVIVTSTACTADDIISWARQNAPQALVDDIRFADMIPRTPTGKIDRSRVEQQWRV